MTEKREILVVNMHDGEVVHRVDVSGKNEADVNKVVARLRGQINEEEFFLEDTRDGRVE